VVGNKEQSIDAASAAAVAPHLRQYSASELTDHAEVLRWINDAVGSYSSPPTAFTIAVPNDADGRSLMHVLAIWGSSGFDGYWLCSPLPPRVIPVGFAKTVACRAILSGRSHSPGRLPVGRNPAAAWPGATKAATVRPTAGPAPRAGLARLSLMAALTSPDSNSRSLWAHPSKCLK
jgi:hypothetical protein